MNKKRNKRVKRMEVIFDEKGKFGAYKDIYTGDRYGLPMLKNNKKSPYLEWYMGNQKLAGEVFATDKDLKGETHRVLWLLISVLDYENWIYISITDIGKKLDMLRPNVSKAIKLLEKKEIIIRGPKIGSSFSFRFNPDFIWKGDVNVLEKYREEEEKKRIKDLKSKTDRRKKQKIEEFSKEHNIPLEKLKKFLVENT